MVLRSGARYTGVTMKRLSVSAILAAAFALLTAPGSALAANARPLSSSALAFPAAFTVDAGRQPHPLRRALHGQHPPAQPRHGDEHAVLQGPQRSDRRRAGAAGPGPPSELPQRRSRVGVRHPHRFGDGDEPAPAHPCRWQRLRGPAQLLDRRESQRRPHHVRPRRQALCRRRGERQPVPRPEPGPPGREDAAAERGRHGALRQPACGQPDHRLRHPQLVRVHLRSADGAPLGDGQRPGLQRRDQPRPPPRRSGTSAGGRRRPAARRPRRRATRTRTGPARCCRSSSSPRRRR